MGYTDDSAGKPVYAATPTQTVVDLQAAVDYAEIFAHFRVGTNSDRTGLAPGELHDGLHFYETDTDSLYRYNSGWRRIRKGKATYTPTWSNFTVGTSSVSAWYQVTDGFCEGAVDVVLASGFSLNSSGLSMSLPVTAANVTEGRPIGLAVYTDTGTGWFKGRLFLNSSGGCRFVYEPSGGSFFSDVNQSSPFTFVATDRINIQFRYEV